MTTLLKLSLSLVMLSFISSAMGAITSGTYSTTASIPQLSVQLILPGGNSLNGYADGTRIFFSDDFSNSIKGEDSYKFTNPDENIAVVRDGISLSMEGRKTVKGTDTVLLKMWQLTLKGYSLSVTLSNFPKNIEGKLWDRFLKKSISLSHGETLVPFSFTNDAASKASDRFAVILTSANTLPVTITKTKAYEKNKAVQVEWTAEAESNIDYYEIEKSVDAQNFKRIGTLVAKNNPGISTAYNFLDTYPHPGSNHYRIKTIERSGEVKYSEVVRVQINNQKNAVTVCNNPITGNTIKLVVNNLDKGNYVTTILNISGEKVYTGYFSYPGGTVSHQIEVKTSLPAGVYHLQLFNGHYLKNIQILKQ